MRYYTTVVLAALVVVVVAGFNTIAKVKQAELLCRASVAELNYTVPDTQAICPGLDSENN